MRKIAILLILLSFQKAFGQAREFKILPVPADRNIYAFNDINIFETYKVDSLTFLFGWTEDTARGPKLLVKNKLGQVIFTTSGRRDSYLFRPTFFRSVDSKDPILMLAESGTDYSWGNTVFSIMNDQITYMGEIEVAANAGNNPANIATFTRPVAEGEIIEFNFTSEKVVLNPGTHKQIVLGGNDISYLYKERRLRLNIK